MNQRRTTVRVTRLKDQGRETDLDGTTAAERIGMIWQLTLDAWAFTGQAGADLPMRRDLVRVSRHSPDRA
jgi:hypothetical protein